MAVVARPLAIVALPVLAWGLAFALGVLSHGGLSVGEERDAADGKGWSVWLAFPVILVMGGVITTTGVRKLMTIAKGPFFTLALFAPAILLGVALFGGILTAFFAGMVTPFSKGWWGHQQYEFADNEVDVRGIGFTVSGALGASIGGLMGLVFWSTGAVRARHVGR